MEKLSVTEIGCGLVIYYLFSVNLRTHVPMLSLNKWPEFNDHTPCINVVQQRTVHHVLYFVFMA